jgi:hypothetical protein
MQVLTFAVYAFLIFKSQAVSGVLLPDSTQTQRRFTFFTFCFGDAAVAPVTSTSSATRPISRDFNTKFSSLGYLLRGSPGYFPRMVGRPGAHLSQQRGDELSELV